MGKEGEGYYGVINDISRLVGSQLNKDKRKKYVCDYCLNTQNTRAFEITPGVLFATRVGPHDFPGARGNTKV